MGGFEDSHLFFVDDLILFGQATRTQAEVMRDYLESFCDICGQQISFPKSTLFYSKNMKDIEACVFAKVCGSPLTKDLGNYLGVSLIHYRINNKTYRGLVEKTQIRLAA
ncbi:hypothetical protein Ddye_005062 [Dipteronia dyeriana]|uniref:Reverse transcriptase domain-containing protein n=1 Tax=Dipteronia dyeriana TaxID=168575 RepID=A0AAD9XFK8_9ROSI|nr:hypothetical protein Ddye_005062 [Dipteronia dyeriana]